MAIETKEEFLERILKEEKPKCPHCDQEMNLWEVPPVTFSDGLGWGVPYLFICFNDECDLYKEGWEHLEETVAQKASYRCMCYPGSEKYECMPVFSPFGGQGQVIDDQAQMAEEALKAATKKGFSILATCYSENDWPQALRMLLDSAEPVRVRTKAAEMMGDFGDLESLEPMQNHRFGNQILQESVAKAIEKILQRFASRECPDCAEIIAKDDQTCQHCGKDVST